MLDRVLTNAPREKSLPKIVVKRVKITSLRMQLETALVQLKEGFFFFFPTMSHACQAGEQWEGEGALPDPTTDRFCYACPIGKYKTQDKMDDEIERRECFSCVNEDCNSTQFQTCNRTTGETACVECTTCDNGFDAKNETCTGYINRECVGMFSPVRSLF